MSITIRKIKKIFPLSIISAKKTSRFATGCLLLTLEDERPEEQRDQTAVDDPEHDAAQHIGQVMHPQVHA